MCLLQVASMQPVSGTSTLYSSLYVIELCNVLRLVEGGEFLTTIGYTSNTCSEIVIV